MTVLNIIENSDAYPDRIDAMRRMLEKVPGSTLDRHLLNPEVRANDGRIYVFLPGVVVVYDYSEFMAELRKDAP